MEIKLATTTPSEAKVGLIALTLFEEDLKKKKGGAPLLDELDEALGGIVRATAKQERFEGKSNQKLLLHTHGKIPARYLLILGLGKESAFNTESLRTAAGALSKEALRTNSAKVALAFSDEEVPQSSVRAAAEGLLLGAYRFDKWKSKDDKESAKITHATLLSPSFKRKTEAQKALALGISIGHAVSFARDLVNEPGGEMTPTALANAASKMAKEAGLQVTIHEKKKLEQLKMGMFLGVAQGSAQAPKLIEIRYVPKGAAAAKAKPLAFVGKAITFDSGGLSLKPADAMVDMKTDMAGAAAVFGAMKVIAEVIQPKFPVYAFVGSCENMPSGTSYRPGDILRARNGKTVEITNTDAEGRLVLGDVLTYACETKPRGVVDLATLTGACIVALGKYTVGTFGADDEFVGKVLDAAKESGEDFWRLPLVPEVKENLKSDVADLKNSGTRWGGAISAAQFLQEFVGETPWAHLDIAGPSTSDKDGGYFSKGGTGVGVRTLVDLVRSME